MAINPDMFNTNSRYDTSASSERQREEELPSPFDEETTSDNDNRDPIRENKQWYLVVQEDCANFRRGDRIASQFTPQQVQRNLSSNIVEGGGFSRESPIIQWVGGQLETFSFEARFFSENSQDYTATKKLHQLELLQSRDPNLGRPPLLAFFWGVAIPDGFPCIMEGLGTISYDEIRQDGSIRGFTCQISLKKFKEYLLESRALAPSQPSTPSTQGSLPGNVASATQLERTPVYIAKHGDTYESIAEWKYGDPLLGVLLRQMNGRSPMTKNAPSGVADLQPGEEVKLYPVTDLPREKVKPLCHVLKTDTLLATDNRRRFFELRSKITAVLPRR